MFDTSALSARIEQVVISMFSGNRSKFASAIGMSEATIRSYLNGVQPKYEFFARCCESLALSPEWLLLGKGRMSSNKELSPTQIDGNTELFLALTEKLAEQATEIGKLTNEVEHLRARLEEVGKDANNVTSSGIVRVG